MKSYQSYDSLAIDLDLHFFDKIRVLRNAGNVILIDDNKYWFVVTDDGHCHLFDENGNLDNINKITFLYEYFIRKDIKKIIIPDSVTRIGDYAFNNCRKLTSLIISDSVTNIKSYAFAYCRGLSNVTISDSAKSIGEYAFYYCSSLTSMIMPKSIKYIERNAFWFCKNLKNIFFKGKTLKQVRSMKYYPWGIKNQNIIKAELK